MKTISLGVAAAFVLSTALALAVSPKWRTRGECLSFAPDPRECSKAFPAKKKPAPGRAWWTKDAGR